MSTRRTFIPYRPAITAALVLYAGAALSQITIVPAAPKVLETVRVQISPNFLQSTPPGYFTPSVRDAHVSMAGNKITLDLPMQVSGIPAPGQPSDIALGQLPEGNYELEILAHFPDSTVAFNTLFAVARKESGKPLWNNTGLWWDPAESGWGLNLTQNAEGAIFATWFVYGADGNPVWYSVSEGQRTSPEDFTGPIYRSTGPDFHGVFDPSKVARRAVGTATFSFGVDYMQGWAQFDIDGQRILKRIRRLEF
jgi:hypothetical protein